MVLRRFLELDLSGVTLLQYMTGMITSYIVGEVKMVRTKLRQRMIVPKRLTAGSLLS